MNKILKHKLNLKFEFEESAENALNGYADNDKALNRIRALLMDIDDKPEAFKNSRHVIRQVPRDKMMVEFTAIALTYKKDEKRVIVHNIIYETKRVNKAVWDEINKIATDNISNET